MTSSMVLEMCSVDYKSPVANPVWKSAQRRFVTGTTVIIDEKSLLGLNTLW